MINSNGRTIFVAGAHRGDGKRLDVRADKMYGLSLLAVI
jgi:hypothetical protein